MEPKINNYVELLTVYYMILRPNNLYFPLNSGTIKNISYYYSSLIQELNMDNFFYKGFSLFAKIS